MELIFEVVRCWGILVDNGGVAPFGMVVDVEFGRGRSDSSELKKRSSLWFGLGSQNNRLFFSGC